MTTPTSVLEHVNIGPDVDIKLLECWDGSGYVVTHRNGSYERDKFVSLDEANARFEAIVWQYGGADACTCRPDDVSACPACLKANRDRYGDEIPF